MLTRSITDINTVYFKTSEQYQGDDPDCQTVLDRIDGRRSLFFIADSLLASPFEISKIIHTLLKNGNIRPANKEELLNLAQDLLQQDEIEHAGMILKKLRPNLKNLILNECDVSTLADLFYKVGDILTATNILLDKVRESKDSTSESSLPFLKQAHKIAPEDTRILIELVENCEQSGDRTGKLQHLISLAHVYIKTKQYDIALTICNQILEIDSANSFVIKNMPEFMAHSGDKQGAVAFLEEIIARLGKKADANDIVGIYRQILKIDPSRKDITDKLRKAQKKARGSRKPFYAIISVILALSASFLYWIFFLDTRQADMNLVVKAALHMSKGNYDEASALLDLDKISNSNARKEAEVLLATIHSQSAKGNDLQSESSKKIYYSSLEKIHEMLGEKKFNEALLDLKELNVRFDTVTFGKNTKIEIKYAFIKITEELDKLQTLVGAFSIPKLDEKLQEVAEKYCPEISESKLKSLINLQGSLEELSTEEFLEGSDVSGTVSRLEKITSDMKEVVEGLKTVEIRLAEFNSLAKLSRIYSEALKAENDGLLTEALALYTRLVDGYGERKQKDEFEEKKLELQHFLEKLGSVEKDAGVGKIEDAYNTAIQLLKDYAKPTFKAYVKIPILIESHPTGAKIISQGMDLGETPRIIYIQQTQRLNINLEYKGFEPGLFVLERDGGAIQSYDLNRRVSFITKLGGFIEGRPILDNKYLVASSRNGSIFCIDPEKGDIINKYNTGSLSGIPSSVLMAHNAYYFNTMEGEIWSLTCKTLELIRKKELTAGTRCPPIATESGVITACNDGIIMHMDPDLKTILWKFQGKGNINIAPIHARNMLIASFNEGDIISIDIEDGAEKWRKPVSSGSISGLAVSGELLFLCSNNGWVKALNIDDGSECWSKELNSFISLSPAISGNSIFVAANKEIVELNLKDGNELFSFAVEGMITTTPTIENGHLYFGTKDGKLHFRKIRGKDDLWTYQSTGAVTSPPLLSGKNIIMTDADGQITSIIR